MAFGVAGEATYLGGRKWNGGFWVREASSQTRPPDRPEFGRTLRKGSAAYFMQLRAGAARTASFRRLLLAVER